MSRKCKVVPPFPLEAEKGRSLALKENSFQDHKAHNTTLGPGKEFLVKYLSDRGGPGKRKAYWEEKIHGVVERGEPCNSGHTYPTASSRL